MGVREASAGYEIAMDALCPSGYRQTEVGVIPEDWDVRTIREVSNVVRGGSPRPAGDPRYFDGSFIPWLTVAAMTNIPEARLIVSETASCLTEEGSSLSRTLTPGTLIIANSGATLGVAKILGIKCCANDGIAALPNLSRKISARYLAHYINTQTVHLRNVVATGNGQPNLNTALIGDFHVPIPASLSEQQAIAEALSDADALIESLQQLIAKKRQIKQGAMQELLTGQRRLSGFGFGAGRKRTDVGVIPEDWRVVPVGQHLRRAPSYGINASAIPFDSRFPTYLRITDITDDGRFAEATKVSVSHVASTAYLLELGDIAFARTGASVGKSYLYRPQDGRLVMAGFLIRLSPDPDYLIPAFLSFYARSATYWHWVNINSMRSGQPGINGREYASLPIPLPSSKSEQEAIITVLSDMDAEIVGLESRLTKTRELKQGMMRALLTGRIRLPLEAAA